jgi:hypothetical protein
MGVTDILGARLADLAVQRLERIPGANDRLTVMVALKRTMPDLDLTDLMSASHYVLTGSGDPPTVEELQRIEVRNMAGDLVASFPPDTEPPEPPEPPDDAVNRESLDPPDLSGIEPAPSEGEGWQGHHG